MENFFLSEERTLVPNPPLDAWQPAISIKNGFFSWDLQVIYNLEIFYFVISPYKLFNFCAILLSRETFKFSQLT